MDTKSQAKCSDAQGVLWEMQQRQQLTPIVITNYLFINSCLQNPCSIYVLVKLLYLRYKININF